MIYVGQLYQVADDTILLAASSRLTGEASKWYDRQSNETISSWSAVKEGLTSFFGHKAPFTVTMQKITARKWESPKEKFVEYANDKLDIMQSLELTEKDQINLLTSGIRDPSIRAIALTVMNESLSQFLERMRIITESMRENTSKFVTNTPSKATSTQFNRTVQCYNCGRKGHLAKDCRSTKVTCFKCHKEDHLSLQCPLRTQATDAAVPGTSSISTINGLESDYKREPQVTIISINNKHCVIGALWTRVVLSV